MKFLSHEGNIYWIFWLPVSKKGYEVQISGWRFKKRVAEYKCGLIIISDYSPILGAKSLGRYATGSGPVANHTVLRTTGLSRNSKLGNDNFTKSLTWQ